MHDDDPEPSLQQPLLEWDENKRRSNIAKHGIDFVDVPDVFADPQQLTIRSAHSPHEVRYVTIGAMSGKVVAVVSTMRGHKLRIISARSARKHERERYGQIER